ncbi:aggregation-promoting factor C-terminal-like domain-containing protein [Dietzia cinnamea]|uniref:aggregation-promoting factor C-terminal-like domain-containing protein n=1 Tax=Dietzia cinnamea TaxID=321318 RepID=UPI002882D638|nr:tape measure protein [Dietzia cinnamea]
MSAVGYAVLPITPSLKGLGSALNKELMEPARKAARAASADIERAMADATKRAAADVAKARQIEQKSAEAVLAAEKKLQDQRAAAQRSVKDIESAELKLKASREKGARDVAAAERALSDARSSGDVTKIADAESKLAEVRSRTGATVLDRENALERAREKSAAATAKIADVERDVAAAKNKAVEASENVIASTKRLDQAQSQTTSEFEAARAELGRFQDELGRTGSEMDRAAEKSGGFGAKVREGLGKIGTGALLGVGAKIGSTLTAGFGTAITKGFDRLAAIDQAKAALTGLGHSAESVQTIMDSAMEAVKGTAFGFGDAAGLAGTLVASGIEPGQELTRILSLVGDTAAITGSDLGEMGSIWAKVAAGGRMSTEEMNQLLDRGLGILPALSEQYGVTGEEMRKMISEGKVSFEDFAQVMEGVVGGSALTMGDTFKGSFDNMGAALGRFGAKLMGPIFDNAPTVFAAITEAVDGLGERIEPVITEFSERLAPVMADFAERIGPAIQAALNGLFDGLSAAASAAATLVGFIQDNQAWIVPLTAAVLAAVGAYKLLVLQQKIAAAGSLLAFIKNLTVVTKLQTAATTAQAAAQRVLNTVMKANPIMLIVSAVAILATALWAFFTKTETGRKMWANFMQALEPAKQLFSDLADFGRMVADILFRGEFNGDAPFGLEEDSGLVNFLFNLRDGALAVRDTLTGVVDFVKMVGDVLFKGDFSGAPFGLEEDSGVVNFLFGMRDAVISVKDAIVGAWTNVIQPVFSALATAVQWVAGIFGAVVLGGIMIGWNLLSAAFQTAWEGVIKPVWDGMQVALEALGSFFQWVWTGVIQPAWNALGTGIAWVWDSVIRPNWEALKLALGAVGTFFQWVWTAVIQPAWNALGAGIAWVYQTIVQPTWAALQVALGAVGTFFQWVWTAIIQPAWNALGAGIAFVWSTIIQPAWNALQTALGALGSFFQWVWTAVIQPAWSALGNGIRLVIDSVIKPAFDGVKSALQSVGDFFGTIVGGIQRVWDQLRGHVARPINFVIDTVWNNGLVKAWNTIADFLPGLPRASTLAPVAFAEGGPVPFTFGAKRGKDSVNALLMPDEHVWDVANVDHAGGHGEVYKMRGMVDAGIPFTWVDGRVVPAGHGLEPKRFADGGAVDDAPGAGIRLAPTPGEGGLQPIAILAKRLIHRIWPSITEIGGYRQDAYPEHPSGRALDVMVGVGNPIGDEVTSWALANNPILPLIHALWKQTVWMPNGATQPMGDRGNPTQNHMDHPHLWYQPHPVDPNVVPEGLVGHDGLTAADRRGIIRDKVQEILDKAMDPLIEGMGRAIGDPPPEWLGIPPKAARETKTAAVDTAFDFVENIGENLREVYDKAREVKNIVVGTITGLWRDEGGFIPPGQSVVTNETGKPEAVFNWKQVDQFRRILESARDLDHLWEILREFGNLAITGDVTGRMRQIAGDDSELVDAVLSMREQFHTGLGELQSSMAQVVEAAGVKARKGYESELLDFFGFKGLADGITEVWNEFNPTTTPAASGGAVTSGISGAAASVPTDLVYGDPNATVEMQTVELETKMPDLNTGTAGSGPVAQQVREAMAAYGWDSGPQWDAIDWIINKESSWNPTAQNPSSTAYGLFQFLDTTWAEVGASKTDNPRLQAEAAAAYIKKRYTDPLGAKRFWEANGWYDRGGLAFGRGLMPKNTLSPERVLSPSQTAAFESWMASGAAASVIDASHWQQIDTLLESLPSAAQFQRIASLAQAPTVVPATVTPMDPAPLRLPAESGRGQVPLVHIENQYTMDPQEAAREQMREARRASRSAALVGGWR